VVAELSSLGEFEETGRGLGEDSLGLGSSSGDPTSGFSPPPDESSLETGGQDPRLMKRIRIHFGK